MPRQLASHKPAAVILLAILVRLAVLLAFPKVFAFDQTGAVQGSEAYDRYARNLLATGVYGKVTPGVPDAHIAPLYGYVLAVVYAVFGRGYVQVGVFHTLLDALSILMLYVTVRHLFPEEEWIAILSALFYAFYPYLIFQNLTLIDTPLFMTLLHAFVLLLILLRERPTWNRGTLGLAVLCGLVLGLATLVRAILPLLAIFAVAWFGFRLSFRQTVLRLLPVAVVAGLPLLPWIIRNYRVFGVFVPVSLNSGENFYQGNDQYTVPYLRSGYDVQWVPLDDPVIAQIPDPFGPEANSRRFQLGLQYLRDNPAKIPELLWVKFLVHWSIDVAPRFNPTAGQRLQLNADGTVTPVASANGNLTYGSQDPVNLYSDSLFSQLGRAVHLLYYGTLFFLALVGVALSWRRWRDMALLWFVQISMTVVYVVFHPSTRYRVPSDPLLFVFSAYVLVWLWHRYGARRVVAQAV